MEFTICIETCIGCGSQGKSTVPYICAECQGEMEQGMTLKQIQQEDPLARAVRRKKNNPTQEVQCY
ncbi:MAG TPA: hypothetical protein VK255_03765 [Patescibacteria group bacterium]|nr:hypothetical protein [Patescibacteria group bacterium]